MPALAEVFTARTHEGSDLDQERHREETWQRFLERIGRPDLGERLTPQSPWAYFAIEVYDTEKGLRGNGGFGVLAGDTIRMAERLRFPFEAVIPLYPQRSRQIIKRDFAQMEVPDNDEFLPENFGFTKCFELENQIKIYTNNHETPIDVYHKGKTIGLYERGLGEVYAGNNDCEHRLYQEVVTGFGGMKALGLLGLSPSVIHLNESAVVFAGIAYLDNLCRQGLSFEQALRATQEKTILTNHTLVPAANGSFTRDQFERYVFKNIESDSVKQWISQIADRNGGRISLETLALEIAGKFNGVSVVHCECANGKFLRLDGQPVELQPITNGFDFERWVHNGLLNLYKKNHLLDQFGLPTRNYLKQIEDLDVSELRRIKRQAKLELINSLQGRVDQYGNPIQIPPEATLACWARRLADYKRPEMILKDPERLAQILVNENIHLIIAGKTHPVDEAMKLRLQKEILGAIDQNPTLRSRVHFVQDYDDQLAKSLLAGCDIWLNTPLVGKEACGTSWEMAIGNYTALISTMDGGVADVPNCSILKIVGRNYQEEIESLYDNLEQAGKILKDDQGWKRLCDGQLRDFLPTICGSRMVAAYLSLLHSGSELGRHSGKM